MPDEAFPGRVYFATLAQQGWVVRGLVGPWAQSPVRWECASVAWAARGRGGAPCGACGVWKAKTIFDRAGKIFLYGFTAVYGVPTYCTFTF